jgi:signal transduction histidine kinase
MQSDITGQKLSEMKLAESYRELQRLTAHLDNVKEEERTRIARELHDEMGATLAAMKMRVSWLASKLPPELTLLSEEAGHINGLVADGVHTLHQIVRKLRPSLLEDVGLEAAIEDCVRQFRQNTNIECQLVLPKGGLSLDSDQSSTIFRILQESLSNIAKHAQASKVEITVTQLGKMLLMVVGDNGLGFALHRIDKSFGLVGIRERASMVGGTVKISSVMGKGTQVAVSIPTSLPKQDEPEILGSSLEEHQ